MDGMTITRDGQRMEQADDFQDNRRFDAEAHGHRYIEIELHPSHARGGQLEIRYSGVFIANVFEDGLDQYNLPKMSTNIEGGALIFNRDERTGKWVAFLYDDNEPGVLRGPGKYEIVLKTYIYKGEERTYKENKEVEKGPLLGTKGYNRDWLASHWHENMFIIKDPEVRRDVENRYKMSKGDKPAEGKPVTELEETNQQVAELQKKLEIMNSQLESKEKQLADVLKLKAIRRPAKRRGKKGKRVLNDKHKTNDIETPVGSERLEPAADTERVK